mgnify:FL=1
MALMKKRDRLFVATNLGPAVLCFLVIFAYPLLRTILMSFYKIPAMSSPMSQWEFVGLDNYTAMFGTSLFLTSLKNIFRIWLVGGVLTLGMALSYAVILSSGVKGKSFWRSAIYLPNTVNAVALSTMWTQYVFNIKYGLSKTLFTSLGLTALAKINWTSPVYLFWGMLISYALGSLGYFMLIFLAGIERIPKDIYASATLDGANAWVRFWSLTFPLIRDVTRTAVTLWTIGAVNFFTWAKMFSAQISATTVTPVYYLYDQIFGAGNKAGVGGGTTDVGGGAAIGVTIAVIVLLAYFVLNHLMKKEAYEY